MANTPCNKFAFKPGQRFGRLTIIGPAPGDTKMNNRTRWVCRCDCGRECTRGAQALENGTSTQCARWDHSRIGKRYGKLTVIDYDHSDRHKKPYYRCLCDCGRECVKISDTLDKGISTQCGKWDHSMIGKRYGMLTVIDYDHSDSEGQAYYLCRCDCGTDKVIAKTSLNCRARSCGCNKVTPEHYYQSFGRFQVEGTCLQLLTTKLGTRNTSGVKGVYYDKRKDKWVAGIRLKGKNYYLGSYDEIADAAEARREAEQALFDPILEKYGMEPTSEQEYQDNLAAVIAKHQEAEKKRRAERKMGIKGDE